MDEIAAAVGGFNFIQMRSVWISSERSATSFFVAVGDMDYRLASEDFIGAADLIKTPRPL